MELQEQTPLVNDSAKLDELFALRERVDREIAREVARVEAAATAARERADDLLRRDRYCGTDTGYYYHRRKFGEPACGPCRAAHAKAEAARQRRKRLREAS